MFNCEVKVMYNKRLEMSQCSSITTKLLLNIPMLCKYLCLKNFFPCFSNHAFKPFFFFLNIATFANMQVPSYHGESVRYTGWRIKLTKFVNVNFLITLAATEIKFNWGVAFGVWLPRCLGLLCGSQSREPKCRLTEIYCR